MAVENWYQRMSTVQGKLKEYDKMGFIKSEPDLADVLESRVLQLEALYEVVLEKEKQFYQKLAVTAPYWDEPKVALEILQTEVERWNDSGVRKMIGNNSIKTVLEILTSPDYRRLSTEEFGNIAEEFVANDIYPMIEEQQLDLQDYLIGALNDVLRSSGQQTLPLTKRGTGGQKYIYFDISEKNGKLTLNVNSNLTPAVKSQLKKSFKQLMEQKGKSTHEFSEATKNAALIQRILLNSITDSRVRAAVATELSPGKIEGFNLAKDFNVIKGFLGEVYWSAFFSYLGAKTLPAGDLKDDTSGQSIGVDLLIEDYGFQVKNFNIKADGKISFGTRGGYKSAGTFIQDRAAIDGKLGQVMQDLYGSYAYNVDVSDGEFTETRKHLESILTNEASDIFTHYVDRIIRLDAQQSNEILKNSEAIAPDKGLLFNTFFVIGEKIVPSSAILAEIIEAIESCKGTPQINFQIIDLMTKEGAPRYDEPVEWHPKKMANYTGINYNIDLNVTNLLQKAYNKALK